MIPPEGLSPILGPPGASVFSRMARCAYLPPICRTFARIFCADCTAPQYPGSPSHIVRRACHLQAHREAARPIFSFEVAVFTPGERPPPGVFLGFFGLPIGGQFPAAAGCAQGLSPADRKWSGRNRLRLRDLQRSSWRIFSHMDAESSGHFSRRFSRVRKYAWGKTALEPTFHRHLTTDFSGTKNVVGG